MVIGGDWLFVKVDYVVVGLEFGQGDETFDEGIGLGLAVIPTLLDEFVGFIVDADDPRFLGFGWCYLVGRKHVDCVCFAHVCCVMAGVRLTQRL